MNDQIAQQNLEHNLKLQQESADKQFKHGARLEALRIASNNKPSLYTPQGLNGLAQVNQPNYNLLDESEKIYQWLIKDLSN